MNLKVIVEKGEDGFFIASCPAIKGCHSQGKTVEEALNNIKEAINGCLEVLNKKAEDFGEGDVFEVAV